MALRYLKGVEGYEKGYNSLGARDMEHAEFQNTKRRRPKPKVLDDGSADPAPSMECRVEEPLTRGVMVKNLEVHSLRKVVKLQEEQIRILYGELSLKQNDFMKLQQEASTMELQAQRMAESFRSLEKEKEKIMGRVAECNRERQNLEDDKRLLLIESSKQVEAEKAHHRECQKKASHEIEKLKCLCKAQIEKQSKMTENAAESDERCKFLQSRLDILEKSLSKFEAEREATKTGLLKYGRVFDENLKLCSELKDCHEQKNQYQMESIASQQRLTLADEMCEKLRLERDGLCKHVSSLEMELLKSSNELAMLMGEKGDADAELRQANLLCSSTSAHINELLQEMEVVRKSAKILEDERESYAQRLGEARSETEKLKEEYAKKLAIEKDRADNFSGSVKIQSEQIEKLKREWDASLTSYTEKHRLLQADLLDRESRFQSQTLKNEELLQRQKHMEKKFRKQTSQVHLLEDRLEESMNKCAVLEQEKETLREDIGRLVEQIESVGRRHQEDFASKELENVKLINLVDKTNADLESTKREMETLCTRYRDLEERERANHMELKLKTKIIEDLESWLAEYKNRVYLSEEKFRSLNQEAQVLSREVIDLRNHLQDPVLIDNDPIAKVLSRATAQLQSSRTRVKDNIVTADLSYHSSRPMANAELDTSSAMSTPMRTSESVIDSPSGHKGLSLCESNDLVFLIDRCQYLQDQLVGAYLQEARAEVAGRTEDIDTTA